MHKFLEIYKVAWRIRRSQLILIDEYHPADQMRCPIHFCVGQEATPAALSQVLRNSDTLMSHHRSHGYYLAKMAPLDAMVSEFYGKATGSNGGLSGSQELSHHESNFFSGTILSGMCGMAAGSAYAQLFREKNDITVAVIGDGGMEEGIVFETLNLAALKKLPVLFICENNLYSIQSRINERTLIENWVPSARALGVDAKVVDGNDAILLSEELEKLVMGIRNGKGPFFLEVLTYRMCSHVGAKNDELSEERPVEELKKWKKHDPIKILRSELTRAGIDELKIKSLERKIDDEIFSSIENAKQAPFPLIDDAIACNYTDSFSKHIPKVRQKDETDFDSLQKETVLRPY